MFFFNLSFFIDTFLLLCFLKNLEECVFAFDNLFIMFFFSKKKKERKILIIN